MSTESTTVVLIRLPDQSYSYIDIGVNSLSETEQLSLIAQGISIIGTMSKSEVSKYTVNSRIDNSFRR